MQHSTTLTGKRRLSEMGWGIPWDHERGADGGGGGEAELSMAQPFSATSSPHAGTAYMSEPPQIRLQLMSNPQYLSGARELVGAVAKRLGFADEACGKIALAVDEALCNVIRHGYGRDTNRPIWVSLWPMNEHPDGVLAASKPVCGADTLPSALRIVIEDEARQVDPAIIRSRDLEEIRPGGLGVHIIKAVMDEVTYEKREKVGRRLTMIKRRTPELAEPAARSGCTESGCKECGGG